MRITNHEGRSAVISKQQLQKIIELLLEQGYLVVGPTVRDSAIVYDEITDMEDLPVGWTDTQDGGTYRLSRRDDGALFGYAVGPHSWKKYLHPSRRLIWRAHRDGDSINVSESQDSIPKFAFFGVRSCEIHAMAIQDKVFLDGDFKNHDYCLRRENAVIIAVNCGQAGGTCFCVSMQTGPKVTSGFDLALTEILDDGQHRFLIEVGSKKGSELLDEIDSIDVTDADFLAAGAAISNAQGQMGRDMDISDVKELLQVNQEHPRWSDVASRCLTCGNCTMVCPTCFCTTVEDDTDLAGSHAERWMRWDSCFTLDFSYIHGGNVRNSSKSRYRQWMTHKLAHWIDQFGTSGCVGCGRCITWCPVGIDITEEVAAIREESGAQEPRT
jgi:ferredoxin